ncbi:TetR/AcrR family transcriptional regulator [Streptomyces malaysiense]|uniref:HTH tetR-type domain-containing protein n=1 Tax=Streptomyces malaysiense TaxID=1428626 RepID=A0A1J4Q687_9ACTN|nr:TetR family transcriptional regulator [Streptomyces malaysiense]OIK28707.1 hypothetical protein VT52_004960 [Streptomyces malaysiense]
MTAQEGAPLGLRERKKLATRRALGRAALLLALERGPENVRVDDIAAAVGVAPRTYNNYFSSVEEAICSLNVERAAQVAAGLRARPAGEPLAEALVNGIVGTVDGYTGGAEPDRAVVRVIAGAPMLRGEFLKSMTLVERALAEAIAERLEAAADRELMSRVLAAAVVAAARTATDHWLENPAGAPYHAVLRRALSFVGTEAAVAPERDG